MDDCVYDRRWDEDDETRESPIAALSHALWASGWGDMEWSGSACRGIGTQRRAGSHSLAQCVASGVAWRGVGVASLTLHGPSSGSWTLRYVLTTLTGPSTLYIQSSSIHHRVLLGRPLITR